MKGLQHTILDAGKIGVAQPIEAYLGADVAAVKVSVMYRPEGATDFSEAKLTKSGGCKYTGSIPASAMKGSLIHYFVAAYDNNNRSLASKGSTGSPNIMELSAATGGGGSKGGGPDTEDPIKGGGGGVGSGGDVSGGVIAGGKPAKVYVAVAAGTGFGYVSGNTEGGNTVRNPGIATSLVVITPEIGFNASKKLAIGFAARLGLPIGANIDGHSPLGPAGLLRVHYALSETGEGIRVMGQLGVGIIRNTLKLENQAMPGMDTDIVAQGPLLIGAGIGYRKNLGAKLAFVADLSALAGIAVVKTFAQSPAMTSGVSADVDIGFILGF